MAKKLKVEAELGKVAGGKTGEFGDWIWEGAWVIKLDEKIGPDKRVYFINEIEDDGLCHLDRYDLVDGKCVGPERDHELEPRNLKVVGKPAWVIEE